MPIFYECQRCTACCRWPGQVRLEAEEIPRMAGFLGLEERDFIDRYTRLRADRRGLALTEEADGRCVFLDGCDCRIQPVKPRQCRDFPNRWNFPGFRDFCEAVAVELDEEEYRRRLREAAGEG